MTISRDSLLSLEAYARIRDAERPAVRAHRRLRSVWLGEYLHLQFEDERTVRYQIQEMLRAERVFDDDGIQAEIDAYAALVPDGRHWMVTLLIEIPDAGQRRAELARLVGVERQLYVHVAGHGRLYAVADEDGARSSEHKTSAVHFLRFELPAPVRAAVRAGAAVRVGCDHPASVAEVEVATPTVASLAADLA